MKNTEVKCDGCGADITCTRNSIDYRLWLTNETKPICPDTNTVTALMIYPPLKRDFHFCGVGCLKTWVLGQLWYGDSKVKPTLALQRRKPKLDDKWLNFLEKLRAAKPHEVVTPEITNKFRTFVLKNLRVRKNKPRKKRLH